MYQIVNDNADCEHSKQCSNMMGLDGTLTSNKIPENMTILEPSNFLPIWTMDQTDLLEPDLSDLSSFFSEHHSDIDNINEDNLSKLIKTYPIDNSHDKSESCDNLRELIKTHPVDNSSNKSESCEKTHKIVMGIDIIPDTFTFTIYEKRKRGVLNTSKESITTPACVSYVTVSKRQKEDKSTTCPFESLTKDKIENIDFSCQRCEFVNLTCKACISKTKKERRLLVNIMRKTFPSINPRFIKIFVLSATFEKTRIV